MFSYLGDGRMDPAVLKNEIFELLHYWALKIGIGIVGVMSCFLIVQYGNVVGIGDGGLREDWDGENRCTAHLIRMNLGNLKLTRT
jgi:hypothetical protein